MDRIPIQASDLLKTDGVLLGEPDETLAQAISRITRTHDAIFVFDDTKKFLGVINPYYTIFKSNFPPETKLAHCIFHPPIIAPDTTLWDIATLMAESKLYYLPVMQNNTFHGIVTINRLLRSIRDDSRLLQRMKLEMRKNVITIDEDAMLKDAYSAMRDSQVSRLPIVNANGRLVGMVSRYDIREAFTKPKQKPRFLSRIGEKEPFMNHSINKYSKKLVITVKASATPLDIINTMVRKNIGSVIVQDARYRPVGLISTYDVLKAIASLRPKRGTLLDVNTPDDFVERVRLDEMLSRFTEKIAKYTQIKTLSLTLRSKKNAAGKASRYEVHAKLNKTSGGAITSRAEEYEWKKAVHEVLERIQKQVEGER